MTCKWRTSPDRKFKITKIEKKKIDRNIKKDVARKKKESIKQIVRQVLVSHDTECSLLFGFSII